MESTKKNNTVTLGDGGQEIELKYVKNPALSELIQVLKKYK